MLNVEYIDTAGLFSVCFFRFMEPDEMRRWPVFGLYALNVTWDLMSVLDNGGRKSVKSLEVNVGGL